MKDDRATQAVRAQVDAMGGDVFDIGVFDPTYRNKEGQEDGRMLLRTFDRDTLFKSMGWLKAQNMAGHHIYIRPAGEHSLTLLDDLKGETLDKMIASGFTPAVVVETSPGNYQAWLQHGEKLDKATSTAAARVCAEKWGADMGSADWRHFGRLAGFTNRKPKYQQANGLYPFVRLCEATGQGYDQAGVVVGQARSNVEAEKAEAQKRAAAFANRPAGALREGNTKTIEAFRNDPRYGGDQTRVDLAYAVYAVSHGVHPANIYDALASRDLSHKGSANRQADYIERTIKKAVENVRGPGR